MDYEDVFTKQMLLAACLPAYKRVDRTAPTTCAVAANHTSAGAPLETAPHLIGVACIDVSLVASAEQLEANPGYGAFRQAVEDSKSACPRRTLTQSALQQLRANTAVQMGVSQSDVVCDAAAVSSGVPATSSSYSSRTSPVNEMCEAPPDKDDEDRARVVIIGGSVACGLFLIGVGVCIFIRCTRSARSRNHQPNACANSGLAMSTPTPMGQPVSYTQPQAYAQPVQAQPVMAYAQPVQAQPVMAYAQPVQAYPTAGPSYLGQKP